MLKLKKTSACISGSLFAIIDQRVPEEIENALAALDFEVIKLPECIEKESAVASHTDIVLFKAKDLVIGSQAYFEKHPSIEKKIKRAGLNIIKSEDIHSEKYPYDAIFNALVIGDRLFLKTDSASRAIIDYAGEHNLKVVRTSQGYPACTTLAIGNKHAITSDLGMARLLRDEGIAVLTVPESDKIELPPYKNGFIGGCATVFEDKIFFLGNPKELPYYRELTAFVEPLGYDIVALKEGSLVDLGGMILHRAK